MRKRRLVVWPQSAVSAMAALADSRAQPSLGDAITAVAWLGTCRQEWLTCPADAFDACNSDLPTTFVDFAHWSVIPVLRTRIEGAKRRRATALVRCPTFFIDDIYQLPWTSHRFAAAFKVLRGELLRKHVSFRAEYVVNHYPDDPMRIPASWLTMRMLRHTCIAALRDAGFDKDQIHRITGHTMWTIDGVLSRYALLTAVARGNHADLGQARPAFEQEVRRN